MLWLNDVYDLDVTCIRLTPYRVGGRLVVDLQQLIPLPEATEYTVGLRRREATRAVNSGDGRDLTRYAIADPSGTSAFLPKRRALLLSCTGCTPPGSRPRRWPGSCGGRSSCPSRVG